jgi:hypothetical protein
LLINKILLKGQQRFPSAKEIEEVKGHLKFFQFLTPDINYLSCFC